MSKEKKYKVNVIRTYYTNSNHTVKATSEQEAREKADELSGDVTPGLQLDEVKTEIVEIDGKHFDPKEHGYIFVPTLEGNFYVRETFDADPDETGYDIYDLDLKLVGRIDGEHFDTDDEEDMERLAKRIADDVACFS